MSSAKVTISLPEFARQMGISRSLAYKLAANGVIPVIKLGQKRIVVPVWAVDKMLRSPAANE